MHRLLFISLLIAAPTLTGCNRSASQAPLAETPPAVPVAQPVERKVTDFVDYTGRTNAMFNVTVQARVTGYLVEIPFKEGDYVQKGEILFKIDPRPYEAQFKAAQNQLLAAKSQLAANQAKYRYDVATNKRFRDLAKVNPNAVSPRELDQYQALEDQSKANVDLAEANLALAQANLELPTLNLEWTKVRSLIDGHISRYFLTVGNLVNQDVTPLTTVVSVDPMYVYFDMDEPTLLRIKHSIHEGKTRFEGKAEVYMALQGEEGFLDPETGKPRHLGIVNFVDNKVNPGTDSIQVRGIFKNPELASDGALPTPAKFASILASLGAVQAEGPLAVGSVLYPRKNASRLLVPGMFVRVRFPIGVAEKRLLVIDRAIISEQGQKKIFVVNGENKVEERTVTLGPLLDDGLRVVSGKNFGPNEWVIFSALQQVRPGMVVTPEHRTMPELGKPSTLISDKGKKATR